MKIEKIKKFADEHGLENVRFLSKWKGYDVYEFSLKEIEITGEVQFLFVKGDSIHISGWNESMEYIGMVEPI